jgi:hypothetical protein
VSLVVNGIDTGSGVQSTVPAASPLVLSAEGDAVSGTVTVTDRAGNSATFPSPVVRIDETPPIVTVSVPGDGAIYLLDQPVTASWSASDALSGLASASGTVASGSPIDTPFSALGPHTFSVTGLDNAGNSTTVTHTYFVQYSSAIGHVVLSPIQTGAVFKVGSTVPVKFQVFDFFGTSIGTPGVVQSFVLVGTSASTTELNQPLSTSADGGFRWDPTAQQWVFNLSTDGGTSGLTYDYQIGLNDGTAISFQFRLK